MAPFLFLSTNGKAPRVNLRDALLTGQAPDRGLYFPERFPKFTTDEIAAFTQLHYHEVAFLVLSRYTEGVIEAGTLAQMCREIYNFEIPLELVEGMARVYCLRLDCGPTASFKDFAAQMMARMFGPVDGKFDDCQAMVKRAFADPALGHISLSSANSINIGRLLPQSVYYFYAASRVANPREPVVFCVPSGNFGDMMGAVVAGQMALPIKKLIAPVNDNDAFPKFLDTGEYQKIVPSRNSLSNAMNVGHASNLARLLAVYGGQMDETGKIHKAPDLAAMRRDLFSSSVSDERTRQALRHAWTKHRLLVEPHGAVAWQGFLDWLAVEPLDGAPAVLLETAHPAKFPEEIEKNLGFAPDVPPALIAAEELPEDYDRMEPDYEKFRSYLIQRHAAP